MSHFPEIIRRLAAYEGRFDAYQLEADGCKVLFASYPAGTEIERHAHATDNVGVITQGELILIAGGVERRYRPGDWYCLAAGELHSARFEVATAEVEFWFETGGGRDA